MAHNNDIKRKARSEYIFKRKPTTMIALSCGVSAGTVRRWKRQAEDAGDNWDTARAAHMISGDGLDQVVVTVVEEFMVLAQNMIEELKAGEDQPLEARVSQITSLADAMNKMTASAGKLAPNISERGVAQDVLRRLLEYVRSEFPQHGSAVLEIIEPFGEELVEVYG